MPTFSVEIVCSEPTSQPEPDRLIALGQRLRQTVDCVPAGAGYRLTLNLEAEADTGEDAAVAVVNVFRGAARDAGLGLLPIVRLVAATAEEAHDAAVDVVGMNEIAGILGLTRQYITDLRKT